MSSEFQPLLINSKKPENDLSTKETQIWCNNTKYIIIGLIFVTLIISGIFWYSGSHVHNKDLIVDPDLTALTTVETVQVTNMLKRWTWSKSCSNDETIELTFAIKQTNVDKLHSILEDISNTKSPNYGKHYTWEEINALVAPKDESINTVISWLISQGVDSNNIKQITPNSDFLRVSTTIQQANALLNCEYGIWINTNNEQHRRVKDNYFIPKYVAQHIDFVSPTLRFPVNKHIYEKKYISSQDAMTSTDTSLYVTPPKIKSLYSFPSSVNLNAINNSQCIASFLSEYYDDSDLAQFWKYFNIKTSTMIREPYDQPDGYGSEAELDVQYITSSAEGVTTYVWYIDDDGYFISLVENIALSGITPYVVSMSYGGDEQSNGYEYCSRGNIEFAKGSALGITFFASSGDEGAAGETECGEDSEYLPSFPATSPYVIAVGGTYGGVSPSSSDDLDSSNTNEEGWFNSGGGFSVYFDRPSFQNESIIDYLSSSNINFPLSSRYNSYGRGYPDISAQSVSYIICYEGSYWSVSGTSCSSPAVAGMFTMINDLRLQAGKSTLGWLNPALYDLYSNQIMYFNDVTTGTNEGCEIDNEVGFSAASGWDPVTGLGTPKLSQLIDYFVNL